MGIEHDQGIPWAMSEIKPSELVSTNDKAGAEYWASEGLATWKWDRCNCGQRYALLSPDCVNKREHELVAARLEMEEKESEALV